MAQKNLNNKTQVSESANHSQEFKAKCKR